MGLNFMCESTQVTLFLCVQATGYGVRQGEQDTRIGAKVGLVCQNVLLLWVPIPAFPIADLS